MPGKLRTSITNAMLVAGLILAGSCPAFASALARINPEWMSPPAVTSKDRAITVLGSYDLVLLIDRSGSMSTVDCANARRREAAVSDESRWQWCCEQTRDLAARLGARAAKCFRVVVFSSLEKVYESVGLEKIFGIFHANPPKGSTNIVAAIRHQLDDYFRRKLHPEKRKGELKPLLLAVITDGHFKDEAASIRHVIERAGKRMNSSDHISIVFLQVGKDEQAGAAFDKLLLRPEPPCSIASLMPETEVVDMVRVCPFSVLCQNGLTDTLLGFVSMGNGGTECVR